MKSRNWFNTEQAAHDALSAVALTHARQQAGLPQLLLRWHSPHAILFQSSFQPGASMLPADVALAVGLTDAVGVLSHIVSLTSDESMRIHRADPSALLDTVHAAAEDVLARLKRESGSTAIASATERRLE